jgi:hypothetical protein
MWDKDGEFGEPQANDAESGLLEILDPSSE